MKKYGNVQTVSRRGKPWKIKINFEKKNRKKKKGWSFFKAATSAQLLSEMFVS